MKWEKFEPGELYKFEVSRIDRKDGKNYFVLRRRGLETRPGWVKQGLVYHVSVLPTQENMELEKFVGQSLKCRVITLKGDFPVLEQCVADGGEHVLTNSQIPNFIESTQQSRKTQLRGVSNGRFGRKKSQESLSKTLHVLNVPKTIELPSEDKWELADVLYPSAPKETPPPTPKKSATAVTATKAQPPATERKTPATHSEVSKSGVAAPVQKSAVERKIEKHALFEQIVQQIEKLDSTLQYKLAKRCLEAAAAQKHAAATGQLKQWNVEHVELPRPCAWVSLDAEWCSKGDYVTVAQSSTMGSTESGGEWAGAYVAASEDMQEEEMSEAEEQCAVTESSGSMQSETETRSFELGGDSSQLRSCCFLCRLCRMFRRWFSRK